MHYRLTTLTAELVYIRWYSTRQSHTSPLGEFIPHLQRLLDESPTPLYFLSDLRKGRIMDMAVIQQLGALTNHPNWAGSAAFSDNPISQMLVGNFNRVRADGKRTSREIYRTPEQAIAALLALKADLAGGVDWNTVLMEPAFKSASASL